MLEYCVYKLIRDMSRDIESMQVLSLHKFCEYQHKVYP